MIYESIRFFSLYINILETVFFACIYYIFFFLKCCVIFHQNLKLVVDVKKYLLICYRCFKILINRDKWCQKKFSFPLLFMKIIPYFPCIQNLMLTWSFIWLLSVYLYNFSYSIFIVQAFLNPPPTLLLGQLRMI
jgi:hypothetical protein